MRSREEILEKLPLRKWENLDRQGYFYVGGKLADGPNGTLMQGQMYVEAYVPKDIQHDIPLVLIHGAWACGTCWMGTPDGRAGWLEYFLKKGFIVYVVDQPFRGRSCAHSELGEKMWTIPLEGVKKSFAGEKGGPGSGSAHTQWPKTGRMTESGLDETLENLYAMQVESLLDQTECQRLFREAGIELLKKIGPAVIIGHSQAGPYSWILADACPDLVKAAIAIEPTGPPFTYGGLDPWLDEAGKPKNWGVSQVKLKYEPPAETAAEMEMEFVPAAMEGYAAGYLQKEPARKLVNLTEVPTAVITSEASFHTPYDYLTAEFLKQAGVPAEYIYLPDLGICGNGHYMLLEKNSDEIAEMICQWIERKVN